MKQKTVSRNKIPGSTNKPLELFCAINNIIVNNSHSIFHLSLSINEYTPRPHIDPGIASSSKSCTITLIIVSCRHFTWYSSLFWTRDVLVRWFAEACSELVLINRHFHTNMPSVFPLRLDCPFPPYCRNLSSETLVEWCFFYTREQHRRKC